MGRLGMIRITLFIILAAVTLPGKAVRATTGDVDLEDTLFSSRFTLGYRVTDSDGIVGRAAEYTRQKDSVVAGADVSAFSRQRHFRLTGVYLNDAEYLGEAHFDYKGLLRLNLYGESLYHNLDHIPYPERVIANPVTGTPPLTISDQDPRARYHVEVKQSSVHARGKLPDYPAHVNLAYWRLDREGKQQLRYIDESCGGCHKQSRSRALDRVTEEFSGSVDAHLGPIDLIFEQLVRLFRNEETVPTDTFEPHYYRTANAALLEHDEVPDSRLTQSTIKAHTSLSGGLNAAASFTLGSRRNESDLKAVAPVEAETDFTKTVGDVTYVPGKHWTFNFRYRLLDMDSDNTDVQVPGDLLADPNSYTLASVDVRDSIDLNRAWYSATGTWRPRGGVTLKGEYRRVDIDRSNTGGPDEDSVWDLPARESRNTFRLGAYLRPRSVKGLKINTWYKFRTDDDPAYATTVARGHEGFASLTLVPDGTWGGTLNGRLAWEENNERAISQANADSTRTEYHVDRRRLLGNLGAGVWAVVNDSVHLSLNYGYFRTRIVQDLVFGQDTANLLTLEDEDVQYVQQVHTATAAGNWRIAETLTALLEGHYSRSRAAYDPDFATTMDFPLATPDPPLTLPVDSSGLKEVSKLDIQQLGLQAGLDWRPDENWTCSARYSYDDYDDNLSGLFEGSSQTVTVTLARAW